MKNNTRKINFYTQGRRLAARVLFMVWLLVSWGPENALAWDSRIPGPLTIVKGVLGAAAILLKPGSSLNFQQTCPSDTGLHLLEMTTERDGDTGAVQFDVKASCQEPLQAAGADSFWKKIESFFPHQTDDAFLSFTFKPSAVRDSDNTLAQLLISCLRSLGLPIGTLEMIGGQNLTDVGEEMKYLKVRMLYLTNTALSAIPDLCGGTTAATLRMLNMFGNKLNETSDLQSLGCLTELITLDLRYNDFTYLPDSLPSLGKLENLFLSGNPLADGSDLSMLTKEHFPKLATLWLSETNLTKLPEPVKAILPELETLYLTNTPACTSRFNSIKASKWNVSPSDAQKIYC